MFSVQHLNSILNGILKTDWDYGQIQISTNNGSTWISLQGLYTNPGVGSFQPNGEPLYDGTQLSLGSRDN